MIKKVITFLSAAALVSTASGYLYADACGEFSRDNEAAQALVNKYMSSVMRSYEGDEDVSFRGIVKEGCDFWYYNDYNNDLICEMSKSEGTAESADFSINVDSVSYSDHCYTIKAEITQEIKYKDSPKAVKSSCAHTFTIEQSGRFMYITNDISDGTDKLLAPAEGNS